MPEIEVLDANGEVVTVQTNDDPPTGAQLDKVGTRAYGAVSRIAAASATTLSAAIAASEVLLHASVKQYVAAVSGEGSPTITAETGIPLEAGEKFHMRITSGERIATIRDTEDGFLHIASVS
ncbi:MAG TPA: hypothetical protein VFY63_16820 [Pseudorhizobium sp.]|nr:hypothetical protein [Pseudorhizobium sp.]